ncbi:MAG: hypothetical protein R2710_28360 [Acidimicrobiales bacterium]
MQISLASPHGVDGSSSDRCGRFEVGGPIVGVGQIVEVDAQQIVGRCAEESGEGPIRHMDRTIPLVIEQRQGHADRRVIERRLGQVEEVVPVDLHRRAGSVAGGHGTNR